MPRPRGPRSHTDTHCTLGPPHAHHSSPGGHARVSPARPLAHRHSMHTHTHPRTPGAWVGMGRLGDGEAWVCSGSPPHPAASTPPAATPRTELCNWLENCQRNANWKTNPNPRAGQPQVQSTSSPPPPPPPPQSPAARGGGGRLNALCFRGAAGPGGGVGDLGAHSQRGRVSCSWFPWLALPRRGGRSRARGAQSCPCRRRRGCGPSPCLAGGGGRGGGPRAGPRRC